MAPRGRPKVYTKERVLLTVRIDEDLRRAYQIKAALEQISLNSLVDKALREYLERQA